MGNTQCPDASSVGHEKKTEIKQSTGGYTGRK
jgi:hypothetical protein